MFRRTGPGFITRHLFAITLVSLGVFVFETCCPGWSRSAYSATPPTYPASTAVEFGGKDKDGKDKPSVADFLAQTLRDLRLQAAARKRWLAQFRDPVLLNAWKTMQQIRANADLAPATDLQPIEGKGYQVDFPGGGFRMILDDGQGNEQQGMPGGLTQPGGLPIMPQFGPRLPEVPLPKIPLPEGVQIPGLQGLLPEMGNIADPLAGLPRSPFDDNQAFKYRLARVGRSETLYDRMKGTDDRPRRFGSITFFKRTPNLIEVYDDRKLGVEQSFYVVERPAGEGDLVIDGLVQTDLVAGKPGKDGVEFLDPQTRTPVLRFGAVTVVDSDGRKTAGKVTIDQGTLSIRIPAAWVDRATFPILCDPLIGPNVQISSNVKDERYPAIAHDPTNNRYCVAYEFAFSGTDRDIYAQLVNADGTLFGSPVVITQATNDERFPKVAFSPAVNRFLIVWEHAGKDIRGRIMNADLTAYASAFFIDGFSGGVSQHPDVRHRVTNDDWCVVWTETGNPGSGSDLFGELINTDGTVLRDDILIRDTTADLYRPDLAYNETRDEFFMVYESATNGNVYGLGFDGGLTVTTTPVVAISEAANTQDFAAVGWVSTTNEYMVVYESDEAVLGDDNVRGQRIESADGGLMGASFVIGGQVDDEQDPDIAYSIGNNCLLVVWDWRTPDGDWDVMGQELGVDGTLEGSNFQVSQSPSSTSNEFFPALAYNSNDMEFLSAWHDGRNGTDFNIWAQRLSALCQPLMPQEPVNNPSGGGGDDDIPPTRNSPPPGEPPIPIETGAEGTIFTHSGEFIYTVAVASFRPICPPLAVALNYQSANPRQGDFGVGWFHNLETQVETTGTAGASNAIFYGPTGRVDTYAFSGGMFVTPAGFYNQLSFDQPTNTFTLLDRHGGSLVFAQQVGNIYKLTAVRDRNGEEIGLTYTAQGKLQTIVDDHGNTITVAFSVQGFISSFTDWTGRTWSFEQDANGDLTAIVTPTNTEYPTGKRMTFTYLSGQAQPWMNHNLETIRDFKNQLYLQNVYQATTDRVIQQRYGTAAQVYNFQYLADRTIETDRRGYTTTYFHNAQGNATRIIDQAGYEWNRTFNSHMEVTSMSMPRGNSFAWVFDVNNPNRLAQGNMLEVRHKDEALGSQPDIVATITYELNFNFVKTYTDPRSKTWTYVFDYEQAGPNHGNVVEIHHPIVNLGQPSPQTAIEYMTYSTEGHVTSYTSGEGNLTTFEYYPDTDPRGCLLQKRIEASGTLNLTTIYDWSVVGELISVTDPRNNTWSFTLNVFNETTRITAPAPLSYQVNIVYDANSNPTTINVDNIDENGVPYPNAVLTTSIGYNTLDNPTSVTQEINATSNAVTVFQRDLEENVDLITLPEGNQVKTVLDPRGIPSAITRGFGSADASTSTLTIDGNQNLNQVVFGEGGNHKLVTTRDGFDRATSVADGLGHHTDTQFNENSSVTLVKRVEAGGTTLAQTTFFRDERDRPYQLDRLFLNSSGGAVGDGIARTAILLNKNSQAARVTDDNNHASILQYDLAARLTTTIDAFGNDVVRTLDPNGNVTLLTENEIHEVTSQVVTTVTQAVYDVLNRPTSITEAYGTLNLQTLLGYDSRSNNTKRTDAENRIHTSEFDGRGLPLATRFDTGGLNITVGNTWNRNGVLTQSSDGNGNNSTYTPNARDLITLIQYADLTSKTLVYNLDDAITQIIDQNSSVITNTLDVTDQVTQRDIQRGAGVLGTTQEVYVRDGAYRATRAENRDGATTISVAEWLYNTLGMVDTERLTVGATATKTMGCGWDGVGNQTSLTYPSGLGLTQIFDVIDRMKEIRQGANVVAEYKYVGGRVAERTYENGIKKQTGYDQARRVNGIQHMDSVGNVKALRGYAYDKVHNVLFENRFDLNEGDAFRTDGIDQVTGVKYGVPSAELSPTTPWANYANYQSKHEYDHDNAGNRESVDRDGVVENYNSPGGPYQPDPMNEYFDVEGVPHLYDNNGNLTDDGVRLYKYDYRNELLEVRLKADNSLLGGYKFDSAGRRIERVAGTTTQRYYSLGDQILEARDASDQQVERHIWGNRIDELVASDLGTGGTRYYFSENALGSNILATNSAGLVVEEYRYPDIYGQAQVYLCNDLGATRNCTPIPQTQIGNRHMFTGREFDLESGNYHYRARAYSTRLGRFIQVDPIASDRLRNLYASVNNNPVRFTDPFGLESFTDALIDELTPSAVTEVIAFLDDVEAVNAGRASWEDLVAKQLSKLAVGFLEAVGIGDWYRAINGIEPGTDDTIPWWKRILFGIRALAKNALAAASILSALKSLVTGVSGGGAKGGAGGGGGNKGGGNQPGSGSGSGSGTGTGSGSGGQSGKGSGGTASSNPCPVDNPPQTVYHGTDSKSAESIVSGGLSKKKWREAAGDSGPDEKGFSVTTDRKTATAWAEQRAAERGGVPTVIEAEARRLPLRRGKRGNWTDPNEMFIDIYDFPLVGGGIFRGSKT